MSTPACYFVFTCLVLHYQMLSLIVCVTLAPPSIKNPKPNAVYHRRYKTSKSCDFDGSACDGGDYKSINDKMS